LKYAVALLGLITTFWLSASVVTKYASSGWQGDDFVEFYAAGRVAPTGSLYDANAIRSIETQHRKGIFHLPFVRLPLYAWLLKPFAALSYNTSRALWFLLSALAAVLVVGV